MTYASKQFVHITLHNGCSSINSWFCFWTHYKSKKIRLILLYLYTMDGLNHIFYYKKKLFDIKTEENDHINLVFVLYPIKRKFSFSLFKVVLQTLTSDETIGISEKGLPCNIYWSSLWQIFEKCRWTISFTASHGKCMSPKM